MWCGSFTFSFIRNSQTAFPCGRTKVAAQEEPLACRRPDQPRSHTCLEQFVLKRSRGWTIAQNRRERHRKAGQTGTQSRGDPRPALALRARDSEDGVPSTRRGLRPLCALVCRTKGWSPAAGRGPHELRDGASTDREAGARPTKAAPSATLLGLQDGRRRGPTANT